MADRELSAWRMDHELQCARAPRLDGLRHVGWLYENEAEGVHSLLGHTKKAQLDVIRGDGFATYPIYAGPRHAGAEPSSPDGVVAVDSQTKPPADADGGKLE